MNARKPSPDEIMEELRRLRANANANANAERQRLSLLHDVSVYQEELIAQNDALRQAQTELEESRDRFVELYDFAPTGYLTLDQQGVITDCNLTAAAFFGRTKAALRGMPLLGYVAFDSRPVFLDFLRRCRGIRSDVAVELDMRGGNGDRCVQILSRPRFNGATAHQVLTALIDVTERKASEHERERLAREHAALVGRLMSVQEDERARLARNLHDDMGQEMTALRLMVELLASERSLAAAGRHIVRIQELLGTLDRRMHFVASDLRPAALDLGIAAALEQLARQWSETFGIPVKFCSGGVLSGTIGPEVETHLYRITQEALNNVSKHAAASSVSVVLERQGVDLVLEIGDDGAGFDVGAARDAEVGLGLVGMRERSQLIGGHLSISSRAGAGTLVSLRLSFALVRRPAKGQQAP